MDPHYANDWLTLYTGDASDVLGHLPDTSVDCVVTSPPYWGLRDYGTDRQLGMEPTPEAYVDALRAVFGQLQRVLVDTGTVWLNLGDTYSSHQPRHTSSAAPRKSLVGIPWRVAFALQRDGWIVRNAIVWHKPNAMPESVRDRLSARYELVFLLAKQGRYWFDLDPIRQPLARPEALREGIVIGGRKGGHAGVDATARRRGTTTYGKYQHTTAFPQTPGAAMRPTGGRHAAAHPRGKNPGDVWTIPTRPLRAAHFAPFPIDIPLRCIAAGCPPNGLVLDPFSGAATTALAAQRLGRRYIGIDLNPAFHNIGLQRLGYQPRSADPPSGSRAA